MRDDDDAKIETLVQVLKTGGPAAKDALEGIYLLTGDVVLALATRRTSTPEEAEDVVQHIFEELPKDILNYHPKAGTSFVSWLCTLTYHRATDMYRRKRSEQRAVNKA